jgi:hypothetical protein
MFQSKRGRQIPISPDLGSLRLAGEWTWNIGYFSESAQNPLRRWHCEYLNLRTHWLGVSDALKQISFRASEGPIRDPPDSQTSRVESEGTVLATSEGRFVQCNGDSATVAPPTSKCSCGTPFAYSSSLTTIVNDLVDFAAANDAPVLEVKHPFNELLHSFEVHYPIRFPRFTTVG